MLYINVYEVGRHYGGPEEGGWWFDSGELVASMKLLETDKATECDFYQESVGDKEADIENPLPAWLVAQIHSLCEALETVYAPSTHRYSVRPQGSDYTVRIEEHEGQDWPEEQPTYS